MDLVTYLTRTKPVCTAQLGGERRGRGKDRLLQ